MPGARRTRSLACEINKAHELATTGSPDRPGIPCAMVLTVSFVLSPVTGLVCHRRSRRSLRENLTPASGRQDHTTSPSAHPPSPRLRRATPVKPSAKGSSSIIRPRARARLTLPRPPHPAPNVRDDHDTPLYGDGMDWLYYCFE
jgi:hypothetical protein